MRIAGSAQATIIGQVFDGVAELPEMPGWDQRLGDTRIRRFKAPANLLFPASTNGTVANHLKASGVKWQVESNEPGQMAILAATFGAEETQDKDDPIIDLWEKEGGREQKDLWEIPKVQYVMDLIASHETEDAEPMLRAITKLLFEALLRGELQFDFPTVTVPGHGEYGGRIDINFSMFMDWVRVNIQHKFGTPVANAAAQIMRLFFLERAKGVTAFPIETHVLVRTRKYLDSVDPDTIKADENVDKIFTEASLKSIEGFPTDPKAVKFKLPKGTDVNGHVADGFYLKGAPDFKFDGKLWTVTQHYEFAEYYSTFNFGQAL